MLAIADAAGPEWGKAARDAAVELSAGLDEDLGVRLLSDIRDIFDRQPAADRLTSAILVEALIELPDGIWSEWRGPQDNQVPHKLTQGSLALMLAPFGIRSRSVWSGKRAPGVSSHKGYLRSQFEAAWASYCDEAGTPAHASNINHLRGV